MDSNTLQQILDHRRQWRFVTSFFPPDLSPVEDEAHRRWREEHCDSHVSCEGLFVVRGHTNCSFGNQIYPAHEDTFFFFDSQEPHDLYYPPGVHDITHCWFYFGTKAIFLYVNAFDADGVATSNPAHLIDNSLLAQFFNSELTKLRGDALPPEVKRRLFGNLLELLFLDLLATVLPAFACKHIASGISLLQKQRHDMEQLTHYIRCNSGRDSAVERLAHMANYSKFHFLRLFRQHTGMTVGAYIDQVRCEKMASMRKNGANNKEIAAELGFSCTNAYYNWRRRRSTYHREANPNSDRPCSSRGGGTQSLLSR